MGPKFGSLYNLLTERTICHLALVFRLTSMHIYSPLGHAHLHFKFASVAAYFPDSFPQLLSSSLACLPAPHLTSRMIHSWAQSIICFHSPKCAQCTLRESATAQAPPFSNWFRSASASAIATAPGRNAALSHTHNHIHCRRGFIVRCVAHFTVVDPGRTQPMPKHPEKRIRVPTGAELAKGGTFG